MDFVQLKDGTKDIPKRKTQPRQGLMAAVEVIHTSNRLVKDHLAVPGVHQDLFYNVPLPSYAHGAKVSQPRRRHVNDPEGVNVNVTGHVIAAIKRF